MSDETTIQGSGSSIGYLHSYDSSRRWRDFNACGQAAAATLLDYHGCNPFSLAKTVYDPRDGGRHWEDRRIIDRIKAEFPPDYFFGLFGTTPRRIAEALTSCAGLQATASWSRSRTQGARIWREAKRWVGMGLPVLAVVDRGKLGGRPFAAHWVVVHRVVDSTVHLACIRNPATVSEDRFLEAFACRFMAPPFNHAVVFCRPADAEISASAPSTGSVNPRRER